MIRDKYKNNLILDLDFNRGSFVDQSGNGNDISSFNGSNIWSKNKAGRCIRQRSSSDYMTVADSDSLSFGDGTSDNPFTIIVATFFDGNSVSHAFVAKTTASASGEYYLTTSGNNLYFRLVDDSAAAYIGIYVDISSKFDSLPHLIIASYDGSGSSSGLHLAIDGVRYTSNDSSSGAYVAMENTSEVLNIGYRGSASLVGDLNYVKMYNVEIPDEDCAKFYEEWKAKPTYDIVDVQSYPASTGIVDGLVPAYIANGKGWNQSQADVSSGYLENTGWSVKSGTFQVNDVDGFKKKIVSTTNGYSLCSCPSNQAYGTWEFTTKKTTDANLNIFVLLSLASDNRDNSYYLYFGNSNQVILAKRVAGVVTNIYMSATNYVSSGVEYDVKVTREGNNWNIYIDGTKVNPSTLTDSSHTTSKYSMIDAMKDCEFSNFKFIPYIQ